MRNGTLRGRLTLHITKVSYKELTKDPTSSVGYERSLTSETNDCSPTNRRTKPRCAGEQSFDKAPKNPRPTP